MKKNLLDEIETFQNSHQSTPKEKEFREWLTATLEGYDQWLPKTQITLFG